MTDGKGARGEGAWYSALRYCGILYRQSLYNDSGRNALFKARTIKVKSRNLASFRSIPAGFPQIPRDSRHPYLTSGFDLQRGFQLVFYRWDSKANCMLGLINRTIRYRHPTALLNLYKSLVRPRAGKNLEQTDRQTDGSQHCLMPLYIRRNGA